MISVIVATRDRAPVLERMLDAFRSVQEPPGGWELIVADNGSSDATADALRARAATRTLPLRFLRVEQPGKPVALNQALRLAHGDALAFTDDDCVPDRAWLVAIAERFGAEPSLAGLAGRVEPLTPGDADLATRTAREPRDLTGPGDLYSIVLGCNMAFRRSALDRIGPFDPTVGPGSRIPSGNDIDIVYRLHRAGLRFGYRPEILVLHGHGRATEEARDPVRRRYLIGRGGFYCKWVLRGDLAVARMAGRELFTIARGGGAYAGFRRLRPLQLLLKGAALRLLPERSRTTDP